MIPARIEGTDIVIGAPPNWDERESGRCMGLPVRLTERGGNRWMESAWRPSPAELDALNRGACVLLMVSAAAHPVVSIGTTPIPGVGEDSGMTRCRATDAMGRLVMVWDEDAGRRLDRDVLDVDCEKGEAVCYVVGPGGKPVIDPVTKSYATEVVRGRFSIRWA